MKNIATITYHSSYNFGSCLQAYALQEYVKKLVNCNYEIINLRNNNQLDYYFSCFEKKGLKNIIKRIVYVFERKNFKLRMLNYEKFINNYLNVTEQINESKELKHLKTYDFYISGSDQIWNLKSFDFDWSYFLSFTNGKKISYAASSGPLKNNCTLNEKKRIKKYLSDYSKISVREQGTYDLIYSITGLKPSINIDPTLLLKKEDYDKLIDNKRLIKDKYIYLYDIGCKKEYYDLALKLAKLTNYKVVITKDNIRLVYNRNFIKAYYAGPKEFLNLIKNSEFVLTSSYHGTLLSIVLEKPFYSLNNSDLRINNILKLLDLNSRIINSDNYMDKIKELNNINYSYCKKIVDKEREKSKKYLLDALGSNNDNRKK